MIKYFQNRFALSEKGAKDLWRSIAFSTLLNFALRWGVLLSGLTTIAAMMTFMKIVLCRLSSCRTRHGKDLERIAEEYVETLRLRLCGCCQWWSI